DGNCCIVRCGGKEAGWQILAPRYTNRIRHAGWGKPANGGYARSIKTTCVYMRRGLRESTCPYPGRSVPVHHQFGGAIVAGRSGLMGQKSAEVVVPARISAVVHETERRLEWWGRTKRCV